MTKKSGEKMTRKKMASDSTRIEQTSLGRWKIELTGWRSERRKFGLIECIVKSNERRKKQKKNQIRNETNRWNEM